ncbi:probable nucleoporin Nup54 [Daktulosphaira vitifoliae]|uniref:probable nucleoporin Nup54 n=1 Tax=Daktulosphaira vitifoliae TaxID=58002 RepID=UPI0021AAE6CD|nr:probable nucleoporin Nup54 [Daktulosphaira vitifoliae]XP_050542509.1 probable nucleoporin Nup54 [Daktulosphaira vitifoliae]XP_050542518.1 probable nucleoporin Nup54 [Daktulosphaira vitifoliae]XP_050542526.1 probable nucleoporin Nup54 [Daktulosphaira vitifoliae]
MTGFGFNTSTANAFGSGINAQTSSGPFGFGASTTSATPSFGFGSSVGTAPTTSFGFGAPTTIATSSFGFGSTTSATPAFSFNTSGATSTQPQSIFSGLGQTQPGLSATPSFGGTFGSSFGAKPFGSTTTTTASPFNLTSFQGNTTQLQQQHQTPNINDTVINSIVNCKLFDDERDQIICKLNLLQACWGTGKGYYALNNTPPVEYTPQNPLCRFKAITYSVKPTSSSRDALVAIVINKKMDEIRKQEAQLTSNLFAILGSKPNFSVHLDTLKWYTETKSMALIFVEEKLQNGNSKRVSSNDVVNYLMQPAPKQQLTTMGVENIFPYAGFTEENLREYFENPPAGIDLRVWKQAQIDNPNPTVFIPVPIVGFSELCWKYKCHNEQVTVHKMALNSISDRLNELARKKTRVESKLEQYTDKMDQLTHRIVKVLVGQMVILNAGMALRPEEETIKNQLEVLYNDINSPLRFQGKLTEIATLVRLKNSELSDDSKCSTGYIPQVAEEIKHFLELQQRMIAEMQTVVREDFNALKLMKETLSNVK